MRIKIAILALVVFLGIGGIALNAQDKAEEPLETVSPPPLQTSDIQRLTEKLMARNPGLKLQAKSVITKDFTEVRFYTIDEKLQNLIVSKPVGLKVTVAEFLILNTLHLRVGDYKGATYHVVLRADTEEILEGYFGNITAEQEVKRAGNELPKCGTMDATIAEDDLVSEYRLRHGVLPEQQEKPNPILIDSFERWQSFQKNYPPQVDLAMYNPPNIDKSYFEKHALYAVPIRNTSGHNIVTALHPSIQEHQLILFIEDFQGDPGFVGGAHWIALFGIEKSNLSLVPKVVIEYQ